MPAPPPQLAVSRTAAPCPTRAVRRQVTPDVVRALAKGWTALNTLDLYNISPEELPSEVRGASFSVHMHPRWSNVCTRIHVYGEPCIPW